MIRMGRALFTACCVAPLVVASVWGCSAGGSVGDDDSNNGGNDPGGPGGGLLGGGSGGGGLLGPGATTTNGCNQLQVNFESTTPTALIVVDRSSSQWDGEPNHNWEPVKQGLIDVIAKVQDKINIGLVTYTGQNGGTCPDMQPPLTQVTFAKNNLEPIRAALEAIQRPSFKGETPTAAAIDQAVPALLAAGGAGEKFILLVTDGDPDFCNDGDQVCPMDAVVGAVQEAMAQGIGTTVFGLQRTGVALSGEHLRDVANAGAGQPVRQPIQRLEDFPNRCQQRAVRGTYAATGGNAQPFLANATDREALTQALDQVVAGIRSCTFELAGSVKVDLARASQASIQIDQNAPLAYDDPNGWRMVTETQVEIVGAACAQLKSTATRGINFDFPCEIVSPR